MRWNLVDNPDECAQSLPGETGLTLVRAGSGWQLAGPSQAGPSQAGPSQAGPSQAGPSQAGPSQAGPRVGARVGARVDGLPLERAARWLVEQLAQAEEPSYDNGFRLIRLARPALPGAGERAIGVDQTNRSVIVGEQVVVKWLRRLDDADHPALSALAHLAEVGFTGVPTSFGALTWRAPSGRDLPVGFATAYLPESSDGWQWCLAALESRVQRGRGVDFPAALGRLTAGLHVAFATPSSVLPEPIGTAGGNEVRTWHADARSLLTELIGRIGELDEASAGPDGDRPLRTPSAVMAAYRPAIQAAIDRLLDLGGTTPIQRGHGDLHVGQVLNWSGGLAVIDFDGNPVLDDPVPNGPGARRPAARDVAQLLLSLDQVGRIADRRSGYTITAEIDAWSEMARAQLLSAYRAELAELGHSELLDLRLLPSFLVEQACRDLLYSVRFLPRWAYATIDGLAALLADLEPGLEPGRHRLSGP